MMTIPLRLLLPTGSSCQPEPSRPKRPWAYAREVPIWHCSRWGLPCRPCCQGRGGLLPHRFTLTCTNAGGLFSVALSLGFPRPGITRHRRFVESGLSSLTRRQTRPSSHPRIADLRGSRRLVNGEASGKVRSHHLIHLISRPKGPWAKPQPERRQQGFRRTISGHPQRF